MRAHTGYRGFKGQSLRPVGLQRSRLHVLGVKVKDVVLRSDELFERRLALHVDDGDAADLHAPRRVDLSPPTTHQ